MKTYIVAYLNWFNNFIQFTEVEAESGLEAMKDMDGLYKFDHIQDEEKYFQEIEKRGGFVAYE